VVERNGIGWVYMGPRATPPPLPALEWNLVPDNQVTALQQRVGELQAEVTQAARHLARGAVPVPGVARLR